MFLRDRRDVGAQYARRRARELDLFGDDLLAELGKRAH
jgi:hypothetical protein